MNIRTFNREYDMEMVRGWWNGRGPGEFPEKLLPPVGIVVQNEGDDVAACWLYLAVGIGVCWLEFPVSKPGLGMATAAKAFETAVSGLEEIAKAHDYGIMFAHTLPPIARVLTRFGFTADNEKKVTTTKLL